MKKQISIILLLAVILTAHATIRTVSNSPNNFAQFNTMQAAVDASVAGDTVYVHASDFYYGDVTINKKIILIGAGRSPQTSPSAKSWCGTINLALSGNSDESEISGMMISGSVNFNKARINVRITRNYFLPGSNVFFFFGNYNTFDLISDNILIEGNYFQNSGIYFDKSGCSCCGYCTGLKNSLVINNIFINGHMFAGDLTNNVTFKHNLIYGTNSFFQNGSKNFVMLDNILVNVNPTSDNTDWQNNITYNCSGTNTPWIGGTNSGAGNIANTNPNMVDQAAVDANTSNPLLNFTIPSGPANDAGTDAKDLGLMYDLTGFLNWANSRNPKLPVVNNLLINSTAAPGGNLEIHLNATQAK